MFTVHDLDAKTFSRHRKLEKAVEEESRLWRKAAKEGRPGKTQVGSDGYPIKEGHPLYENYLLFHLTEPWKKKRKADRRMA